MASAILELVLALKDEASAGLEAISGGLLNVGTVAAAGVVAGLGAAGAAVVDFASDAQQGVNDFQAALGLTRQEAESMGGIAQQVFGNNWGDSLDDVNQGIIAVRQQMKGLSDGELQGATQSAIALRDVFGMEIPESTAAANTLMEKFGLTSQQAFDFITKAQQEGLDASGDLVDTITEYGVQFSDAGYNAEQFFSILKSGQQSGGTLGLDKVSDLIKEGRIRITEMSDAVVGAFSNIGNSGFGKQLAAQFGQTGPFLIRTREEADAAAQALAGMGLSVNPDDLLLPLTQVDEKTGEITQTAQNFGDIFMSSVLGGVTSGAISMQQAQQLAIQGLGQMDNAIWQNAAGVAIFGTQWEDLGPTAVTAIDMTNTSMQDLAGATDSLNAKYNNWGAMWEGLKRSALVALAPIGKQFLEIANMAMPAVTAAISWLGTGLPPIVAGAIALFQQIGAAIQSVGTFLAPVIGFLQANLVPILAGLGTLVAGMLVPAIAALGTYLAFAAPIVVGLFAGWVVGAAAAAAATIAAAAPLILLGAAVALLVAAWQNNWFGIRDITAAVWAYLSDVFGQLITWFQVNIPIAIAAAVATFNTIVTTIQTVAAAIQGGFAAAVAWLQSTWASIATTVSSAWATITGTIQSALTTIGGVIQAGISIVSTIFMAAWNTMNFVTAAAWSALLGLITPYVTAIANVIGPPIMAAVSALSAAWQAASAAASAAWGAIVGAISSAGAMIGSVIGTIAAAFSTAWSAIVSAATAAGAAISSALASAWASITSVFTSAWAGIQSAVTSGIASITSIFASGWTSVQSQTSGAWSSIQSAITSVMAAIQTAIATGVAIVRTILTTAWAVIVAASQNQFSQIPAIISSAWSKVSGIFAAGLDTIRGLITSAGASIISAAASLGKAIIDGVMSGLSGAASRLSNALKDMAKGALDAAKSALGIASPSKVFAKEVGTMIPAGIGVGITAGMPKLETNLINGIAGLSEAAAKALDAGSKAISAAASYSGAGGGGLSGFLADFGVMANAFNDAAVSLGGRILGTATRFADTIGKVGEGVGKAVAGLEALGSMVAPGRTAVLEFTATLSFVLTALNDTGMKFADIAWKSAVAFAEGAGKMLGMIEPAVKGLAALETFTKPVPGSVTAFVGAIYWLVSKLAEAGAAFKGGGLAAAAALAQAAGVVTSIIQTAVDGFTALEEFTKPAAGSVQVFTNAMYWLVSRFAVAGQALKGGGMQAATALAGAATAVLEVIQIGVDGFTALATFVKPLPGSVQTFTNALHWLVSRFAIAGADLRGAGLAAASAFADAAGAIVELMSGAIDSFAKLATFVAPTQAAINAFGAALASALRMLIGVMQSFAADAVAAAATFGEDAGKAVTFIGGAAESFTKLAEFVAPGQAAISAFGVALTATLRELVRVMQLFAAEAIEAAAVFGEDAGKAVGFIGNAVGSLLKLAEFTGVGQAAIDAFAVGLQQTLAALVTVARSFAAEAVAAAAVFGEGVGKAIGFIGGAVDSFTKLADMSRLGIDHVNAFSFNIVIVVNQLRMLAQVFSVEALNAVGEFSAAVNKAVSGLGTAADSLGKLADVERLPMDAVNAWSFNVVIVVNQIRMLAQVFSTEAMAAAATFSASVVAVVKDVEAAMNAFATLGDGNRITGDVLRQFMAAAQTLVAQMQAYLPPSANTIGQNTVVGMINGILAQRSNLVTAMVNTVMAAVIAARQTLGIASPSKVFEQIGQFTGAGMAGGMGAMQPAVASAGAGLGMAAVGGASGGVARAAGNGGGGGVTIHVETINVPPGRGPITERELRAIGDQIYERMGNERAQR